MLQFAIRVRPGASRTAVGGTYGADALVVAVGARAVEGAANRAVIAALAVAFEVRQQDVQLVAGAAGRSKIVAIAGDETRLAARLEQLRTGRVRRGQ